MGLSQYLRIIWARKWLVLLLFVVIGTAGTDTNHGTAVIGEISGDRNSIGITGICPDALISAAAFSESSTALVRQYRVEASSRMPVPIELAPGYLAS